MHRVDSSRLDLAREFKSNPTGPHSPELQKLLKLLRWEPLAGRFVVVQPRQDGPWYLARTTGPKGHPLEIFYAHGYMTLAQAHWACSASTRNSILAGTRLDLMTIRRDGGS
jgi:hypothetical protein